MQKYKLVCTSTQGKGAVTSGDSVRHPYDCLKVSCGDVDQQWPDAGTGALAEAVLGGMACWHMSS